MTVVGIDDTDSRTEGMCTTYVATVLAARMRERGGSVTRQLLVRLNPAVPHKTRGNAAVALHSDIEPKTATTMASTVIEEHAVTNDSNTAPGLVVAPGDPVTVPDTVASFTGQAIRDHLTIEAATNLVDEIGYHHERWGDGRGVIGALAAVGAWAGRRSDDWTVEHIAYRERDRRGTDRRVDAASVIEAAETGYPTVWDTIDRGAGELVCVPHTPGPILYGIRGDDVASVESVADEIQAEPIDRTATFYTNQGTDDHLRPESVAALQDGYAYRTTGTVETTPDTREGGHVFFTLADGTAQVDCVAFEPTKRFRDRVRSLRVGDEVTVCGEVSAGTLKLEKFAVRELVTTEAVTPTCPTCDRRMESVGRNQGYRCRECDHTAPGKVTTSIDRSLSVGWYEVPPRARRHIAKPLVRGGFDAPTHPER